MESVRTLVKEWIPEFFSCIRGYSASTFKKDLAAGLTVGIVALPLAMAFGIASGVSPERGIFTAIIAGFLISALGGSRVQIGGPTGAFAVLIYDILQRTGYEGLCLATLFAAVLLFVFGLFRVGSWIKYVPQPLIIGFTSGIALLIFSSQIKDFFGLSIGSLPAGFLPQWTVYCKYFGSANFFSLTIGLATFFFICLFRKFFPKIPWAIASMILVASLAFWLQIPAPTIHSKFGSLPSGLPQLSFPTFGLSSERFAEVLRDGFAIAFLGGIESLLSAVVADSMTGFRHKPNCELMAQGVANFASVLFGGIPATGAIARTATNIKSGAETPVAGMVHSVTLWLILFYLSPLVGQIPLASLSAILIVVAWNMSEMPRFLTVIRQADSDSLILLTSFILTVLVDITTAILVSMALAASFLFIKHKKKHTE